MTCAPGGSRVCGSLFWGLPSTTVILSAARNPQPHAKGNGFLDSRWSLEMTGERSPGDRATSPGALTFCAVLDIVTIRCSEKPCSTGDNRTVPLSPYAPKTQNRPLSFQPCLSKDTEPSPVFFKAELERLALLASECSAYFEESKLISYATHLGKNYSSEYALADEQELVIYYIYLQSLPREEVEFDHDLLPTGYTGYGEIICPD